MAKLTAMLRSLRRRKSLEKEAELQNELEKLAKVLQSEEGEVSDEDLEAH